MNILRFHLLHLIAYIERFYIYKKITEIPDDIYVDGGHKWHKLKSLIVTKDVGDVYVVNSTDGNTAYLADVDTINGINIDDCNEGDPLNTIYSDDKIKSIELLNVDLTMGKINTTDMCEDIYINDISIGGGVPLFNSITIRRGDKISDIKISELYFKYNKEKNFLLHNALYILYRLT